MKKKPRKDRPAPLPLRKKMAPLIVACRKACILAPPRTSNKGVDTRLYIDVTWPLGASGEVLERPEGFLKGRIVVKTEKIVTYRYNIEKMLRWFKDNRYITWCSKDVFKDRVAAMLQIGRMEAKWERLLDIKDDFLYNGGIEGKGD